MKKTISLYVLLLFLMANLSYSQAREELNFGLIGVNYEIPIHRNITIAPGGSTNFNFNWFTMYVRGNYYFDQVFGIEDTTWDVYGGAGLGYSFYNGDNDDDDALDLGLHIGGRWFWNDKWGIYLDIGGGNTQGATGSVGLTLKI